MTDELVPITEAADVLHGSGSAGSASHCRKALVEAVMPLEVIAAQNRMKPYRELSPDLIAAINDAVTVVRAALATKPPE